MLTIENAKSKTSRMLRKPQHTFHIRHRPYAIQPFMIAPVLPGETLTNFMLQTRAVTDPIKNPLIGWWYEQYFFYVKHSQMDFETDTAGYLVSDMAREMVLDPAVVANAAGNIPRGTANSMLYTYAGAADWVRSCMKSVVANYFRDEGEALNAGTLDGFETASIAGNSFFDSLTKDADMIMAADVDVDLNSDDTVTASEVEKAQRMWQFARMNNLTTMSYDQWLQTYGVNPGVSEETLNRPELLRFVREWAYPSNTINAATGAPSSAVSWSISERADKDRFFNEPGFIFGVSVARPKVYLSGQTGCASGMLNDAFAWLPAVLRDDVEHTLRKFAPGTGPLPGASAAYWLDIRDLFLYGDQYVNVALNTTDAGLVALPTAGLVKKYASSADVNGLFVAEASNKVKADGIVSLQIRSSTVQGDNT